MPRYMSGSCTLSSTLSEVNDVEYEVIENYNDAIDLEVLKDKITEYFDGFDYIVGDWA
ncbi:MAG: DUF1027 domain-containing protein, partial [Bacteroidaceae bacterium]|nr:DUF1027 domain-containing protein [Bacteroidaceae bacterium]